MNPDTLADVPVFLSVARNGSFTGAAKELGLTTSAISKRIGGLEERLRVKLFNRTTRKVSLSEEGGLFYEYAERIAEQVAEAEEMVSDVLKKPAGVLRLAMPVSFGLAVLNEAVTAFASEFPDIMIHAHQDDSPTDLVEGRFDVAIRIGRLSDSSYKAKKLADVDLALCASPQYLRENGTPANPDELKHHKFLAYQNHIRPKAWIYKDPRGQNGSVAIPCSFTSNNGDILLQAAKDGIGIVLLPTFLTSKAFADGDLVQLFADYQSLPERGVYALYAPSPKTSPKIRAFLDFMGMWFEAKAAQDKLVA
jgi:DNA-binding transcriptional LysR family regulator